MVFVEPPPAGGGSTRPLHPAVAAVKLAPVRIGVGRLPRKFARRRRFPCVAGTVPEELKPEREPSMTRRWHGILKSAALALAVSLPFVLPAQALAETLIFVNDTKATLVVQLATVVRGGARRSPPYTIGPGEKVSVALPGNKLVNVYDARLPNRVLFQGTIPASPQDGVYSIKQPDPRLPKVEMEMVKPSMAPKR
jgi:hypothetical protein